MIRSFAFSFAAAAAVAACATLAAPQASARSLGSVSINTTGPRTPTPWDPWGGEQLCTAHLRKASSTIPGGWDYHMASGYSYGTCMSDAMIWIGMGYSLNPNPGFGLCQCFSGFNGFLVIGPSGTGPLGVQDLTPEQVRRYDEGLSQLRQKYQLDNFAAEHEQLLQSIEATPAGPDGN